MPLLLWLLYSTIFLCCLLHFPQSLFTFPQPTLLRYASQHALKLLSQRHSRCKIQQSTVTFEAVKMVCNRFPGPTSHVHHSCPVLSNSIFTSTSLTSLSFSASRLSPKGAFKAQK